MNNKAELLFLSMDVMPNYCFCPHRRRKSWLSRRLRLSSDNVGELLFLSMYALSNCCFCTEHMGTSIGK